MPTCAQLRDVRGVRRPVAVGIMPGATVARFRGRCRRSRLGSSGRRLRFRALCFALGGFCRRVRAGVVGVQDMLEVPWALGHLRIPLQGAWCGWDEVDCRVGLGRNWRQWAELGNLVVEGTLVSRICWPRGWQGELWCGAVGAAGGGVAAGAMRPVLQGGGRVMVVVRIQEGIR